MPKDVLWTCDKAIYGLRKAPKWWGEERDRQFTKLQWSADGKHYHLVQSKADSQLWMMRERGSPKTLGCLIVYVDDILLLCDGSGGMRHACLDAVGNILKLAKEQVLDVNDP